MLKAVKAIAIGLASVFLVATTAAAGPTLDAVKQRGRLKCGVNTGAPGFAAPDSQGVWRGFDVDFCRAIAAAVLGSAEKVDFVPVTSLTRFPTLQSGEIDVLMRQTTATMSRDTGLGLMFGPTTFYDGQGIMVPKRSNVTSTKDLNGASICVQPASTTELNLSDYFRQHGLTFRPVVIENLDEVSGSFFSGRCDALTSDRSDLASARATVSNAKDYVLMPDILSKEPLAPVVRQGDDQWFLIVKWTVFATLLAEERKVGKATVASASSTSKDPELARLFGKDPELSKGLGLPADWALQVVKQVGNYGEIFEANLGPSTPLGLDRGLNRLWTDGGLHYPLPAR